MSTYSKTENFQIQKRYLLLFIFLYQLHLYYRKFLHIYPLASLAYIVYKLFLGIRLLDYYYIIKLLNYRIFEILCHKVLELAFVKISTYSKISR